MKIKTDQQIRAQAHALPANEHQHVVIRQDEREHGEHEEIEISEETVVAAFMRHVAGGINMDQHADAGDEQQPDAGERIEQESGVGLKRSLCAVVMLVGQVAGIGAEPGVENCFVGLMIVRGRPVCVLQNRAARHQERQHDRPDADRADRSLLQLAPKEKHHRRAEAREERDELDVGRNIRYQFFSFSSWPLALSSNYLGFG